MKNKNYFKVIIKVMFTTKRYPCIVFPSAEGRDLYGTLFLDYVPQLFPVLCAVNIDHNA